MHEQAATVLDHLVMLLDKYSSEMRSSTHPGRLSVRQSDKAYSYRPDDPLIRQNLMEHVGELPVMAVALFPYLDDPGVDLGTTLTMLAIHDIGEVVVGDVNSYIKLPEQAVNEAEAALGLLHPSYRQLYEDVEMHAATASARFARAVDKLTPDVFELLLPAEYSFERLRYFARMSPEEIVPAIVKRTLPEVAWNPFLTALHQEVCERLAARLVKPAPKRR